LGAFLPSVVQNIDPGERVRLTIPNQKKPCIGRAAKAVARDFLTWENPRLSKNIGHIFWKSFGNFAGFEFSAAIRARRENKNATNFAPTAITKTLSWQRREKPRTLLIPALCPLKVRFTHPCKLLVISSHDELLVGAI